MGNKKITRTVQGEGLKTEDQKIGKGGTGRGGIRCEKRGGLLNLGGGIKKGSEGRANVFYTVESGG